MAIALPLAGCGTSVSDICDAVCDCEGCSDAQYDECVREGQNIEDAADRAGCSSAFGDYLSCIDDNATCVNGDYDVPKSACSSEEDAVEHCGVHL